MPVPEPGRSPIVVSLPSPMSGPPGPLPGWWTTSGPLQVVAVSVPWRPASTASTFSPKTVPGFRIACTSDDELACNTPRTLRVRMASTACAALTGPDASRGRPGARRGGPAGAGPDGAPAPGEPAPPLVSGGGGKTGGRITVRV